MTTQSTNAKIVAPITEGAAVEYADRAAKTVGDITPPELIASGELIRYSDTIREIERFALHLTTEMKWARDAKLTFIVIDSGQVANCAYKRTAVYIDAKGNAVIAMAIHALWLNLPRKKFIAKVVHELVHGMCAVAWNRSQSKGNGVAANGQHDLKIWRANAEMFYVPKFTGAKVNTVSKRNMPIGGFNDRIKGRIASFTFDESKLNLRRIADPAKPRNSVKTLTIGCKIHHWDADKATRKNLQATARIAEGAPAVACLIEDGTQNGQIKSIADVCYRKYTIENTIN